MTFPLSLGEHDVQIELRPGNLDLAGDVYRWYFSSMVACLIGAHDLDADTAGALLALIVDTEGPAQYLEDSAPEVRA